MGIFINPLFEVKIYVFQFICVKTLICYRFTYSKNYVEK